MGPAPPRGQVVATASNTPDARNLRAVGHHSKYGPASEPGDGLLRIRVVAADKKVTIVDLCSGKGYLSMLLSEILPRDKVLFFLFFITLEPSVE